ncbi:hypothetical protein RR46_00863 [Papilio xuthus]|uniref:Uncharacterized protein n=1 Tax=Papilio xuthus TaxID=66420 RepID=A0A0N1PFZ1_PAPXU|nr:hypothetical protein RR46_00863 [Papilio xuthus]
MSRPRRASAARRMRGGDGARGVAREERDVRERETGVEREGEDTLDIHKAEYWCATATRGVP